jgi:hypothetical protein
MLCCLGIFPHQRARIAGRGFEQLHTEGWLPPEADRPWRLVYYEAFLSKTDARREELFLKSGKGRERIKYLLQDVV